ncbi:MAG: hypothetical protein AAFX52_05755 [Pseudomonadota bacterium]
MSRITTFLLTLLTTACIFGAKEPPAPEPTLAILHGGALVTDSKGPRSPQEVRVACASGEKKRGDVFAVDRGFPAPFRAVTAGGFQAEAMQVIVFGGTIADTGPQTLVRGDQINGRHVEIATLLLDNQETKPVLDFSVIPLSLMGGAGTVTIEAAAIDSRGQELRTGYPLVGTAASLCGPA